MKLNITSQYAIRIMIFFVENETTERLNAKNISEKLAIPYKYLTRIMTQLVNAQIITSIRGREGGYLLSKEPSQIKILDILDAVNESLYTKECLLGVGLCNEKEKCPLHDKWAIPKKSLIDIFKESSLEEFRGKRSDKLSEVINPN